MLTISDKDVDYVSSSFVDPVGRVFFYKNRLFRTVCCPLSAALYKKIEKNGIVKEAESIGLVKTWFPEDVKFNDGTLLLEHEVLRFVSHSAEMTAKLIWQSANMIVELNKFLVSHGLQLKDCHPWNVMLKHGSPIFIDFGSIVEQDNFNVFWYDELKKFYLMPLWLHKHSGEKSSAEYRREHRVGFGHHFMGNIFPKEDFDFPARPERTFDKNRLLAFFDSLIFWLNTYQPIKNKSKWSDYTQSGDAQEPLNPVSIKHSFVFNEISRIKPRTVLDMAANKGFYSEVAARLGAKVISFDNEEFNVDFCNELADRYQLDITAMLLDFIHPTPPSGVGLCIPSAYERFQADMALVLGLVHHICIGLSIPLSMFIKIVLSYKPKDVIIEFVYVDDVHVKAWKKTEPTDYSRLQLNNFMAEEGFSVALEKPLVGEGVHRDIILFSRCF